MVVDLAAPDPVRRPCGRARRAFADVPDAPASVHRVEIEADARAHHHRDHTEIDYVLECAAGAAVELDGERVAVGPGSRRADPAGGAAPGGGADDDDEPEAGGEISKAEAIRRALPGGLESPEEGTDSIRKTFASRSAGSTTASPGPGSRAGKAARNPRGSRAGSRGSRSRAGLSWAPRPRPPGPHRWAGRSCSTRWRP